MKFSYYIAFLYITLTPLAHGSEIHNGDTEMHQAMASVMQEINTFLAKTVKLSDSDPRYIHKDKFIELALAQKKAVQRLTSHIDERGNLSCYGDMNADIQIVKDSTQEIKDLHESLEKIHTALGKVAKSVIGTRAVQKLGGLMGYCYKDGFAVKKEKEGS